MPRTLAPADRESLGLPLPGAGAGAIPEELGFHRHGIVVVGYQHLEVGDGELLLATAEDADVPTLQHVRTLGVALPLPHRHAPPVHVARRERAGERQAEGASRLADEVVRVAAPGVVGGDGGGGGDDAEEDGVEVPPRARSR